MSIKWKPKGTWRAKLEKEQEPQIVDVPEKWAPRYGTGKMLVPTPLLVDGLMRVVPEGRLVTVDQIRERLARDFGVEATCPLTTGIFLRIAAETAEEDLEAGKKEITPYWRVIRGDGSLVDKFPGGVQAQADHLAAEGQTIEAGKGRKAPRVRDYEKRLVEL